MFSQQDTRDQYLVQGQGCQYLGKLAQACGCKELFPGKSYCLDHVWLVYQKGTNMGNKRQVRAWEKEMLERQEESEDA